MTKIIHPTSRRFGAVVAVCMGVALVATGCSSSGTSTPTPTKSIAKGSGLVNVLYAGSLVDLLEKQVSPGFRTATGYIFQGFAGGSTALAAQIKGKVRQGDVFISASPAVDASLEGPVNGSWVSWYATFATSALVIGYNPQSRFAQDLKTKPWYTVITEPGFQLGSTDPATDPKGVLGAQALNNAATSENEPVLKTLATSNPNIQPEESLVGRLQAGQLDAGFFYASEAKAANIPTVSLTGQDLKAAYTITELKGAPNAAGAAAFITYLLGPDARAVLKKDGYTLTTPPLVAGKGVPASLKSVFTNK